MISQICDTFTCTPSEAMRQDYQLCEEIKEMRTFVHIYEDMKRDKKTLTKDREKYLELIENLSNLAEG